MSSVSRVGVRRRSGGGRLLRALSLTALVSLAVGCAGQIPTTSVTSVAGAPTGTPTGPWSARPRVTLREQGYDVTVGAGFGFALAGAQDLKFKRYDSTGAVRDFLFSNDIETSCESLQSIQVAAWRTDGPLEDLGIRLDVARWSVRASTDEFVDRAWNGSSVDAPPFDSVTQDRLGVFVGIERRWSLERGTAAADGPYVFVGVGGGVVRTAVSHGDTLWAPAFESFVGVAIPISPDVRLRFDALFYVTHDVDVQARSTTWVVDTSGTPTPLGQAHLDTRFFAFQLGVELRL